MKIEEIAWLKGFPPEEVVAAFPFRDYFLIISRSGRIFRVYFHD